MELTDEYLARFTEEESKAILRSFRLLGFDVTRVEEQCLWKISNDPKRPF